ncbi:MAG: hypothetical protein HQL66_09230 [Magnetococcales bacterium]|nr:hypothetical protein [Magnetococcales bacterium]
MFYHRLMETSFVITAPGIIITTIGVLVAVMVGFEYFRLRDYRREFAALREELQTEMWRRERASQRLLASYGVADVDQRIALLEEAIRTDARVFNVHNALGYAWLEKGNAVAAIQAFNTAILHHPRAKEGYCDLAFAHLQNGAPELALQALRAAIKADPSTRADIAADARFVPLHADARFGRLIIPS